MKKKILSFAVVISIMVSVLLPITASATSQVEKPILRRELATLIVDTFDFMSEVTIGESPFTDIDESDPNYEEILACKELRIMNGYEDRIFLPDITMTNAELMTYIYNALLYIEYPMDVPDDAEYDKTKWYGKTAWIMENLGVVQNISDWQATATIDSIGDGFYSIGEEYCAKKNENVIPGDASGDNIVDVKDLTLVRQYVAGGYAVKLFEAVIDVNEDGKVNIDDIILLRQYIVGGYGVELK